MSNVVYLDAITKLNIPADRVLEGAVGKLDGVIIAGYTKDGDEYFCSSYADGGDALWLVERFKRALLNIDSDTTA